jgi:hypothetical protein
LHEHEYEPGELAHVPEADAPQSDAFAAHSSVSLQLVPLPVKPLWHVHVGAAPTLFWQLAYWEHPPLLVAHSLMSSHDRWSLASV